MRIAIAIIAGLAASAAAQSTRDIMHTDARGVTIDRTFMPAARGPVLDYDTRGSGLLWTYNDPASIPESVALANDGTESWVAHNLNDKRISKFTTTGPGTPDFFYSMAAENPGIIGVDAAADASLCAAISFTAPSAINVRAFSSANGNTPLWTYTFDSGYNNSGIRGVAVNADGTRVAAVAYDGTKTLLVYLDAADGSLIDSDTFNGYSPGVEMSANGARILVTNGDTARLYDAASMTVLHTLTTSGSGGYHRISADGTAIAAGGFNIVAAREVAGVWQNVHTGTGSQDWFGNAVALSGDGTTLFVLAHRYGDGYLTNTHRVIDLTNNSVVASWSFTGSGPNQNSAAAAQANEDGTLFACASWGDQPNTQPEVRIFDRDLNLVGFIDTPGSPFELDMTPDGHYILVGSKAVHANTFGSGGRTFAYENDTASCPADLIVDGSLDFFDIQEFLNLFSAEDPAADWNGDGAWDFFDVQAYLADFSAGCP